MDNLTFLGSELANSAQIWYKQLPPFSAPTRAAIPPVSAPFRVYLMIFVALRVRAAPPPPALSPHTRRADDTLACFSRCGDTPILSRTSCQSCRKVFKMSADQAGRVRQQAKVQKVDSLSVRCAHARGDKTRATSGCMGAERPYDALTLLYSSLAKHIVNKA